MNLPTNWKTTAAGILSAYLAIVAPLTAYLATLPGKTAVQISGVATFLGVVARIWIGLIQNDALPVVPVATTAQGTVKAPAITEVNAQTQETTK